MRLENCVVREWDRIYCELLKQILKEGEEVKNRTGINTLSIEGVNFKLDVAESFPILETKKVAIRNALSEIMWIHQAQSNDVRWLQERNNPIWNEWMIDKDGIYREYYNDVSVAYDKDKKVDIVDINGNVIYKDSKPYQTEGLIEGKTIKSAKYYGPEWAYTIGTAYGWTNREFQQSQNVLYTLKNNPTDRRMNIDLNQKAYFKTAVLPPCVWSVEFKVYKGRLCCYVHQRSADVPLGLPFNVSQYSMLLAMFAKASGFEIGTLNYSIMDAHVYVNQLEGIKKQLENYKKMLQIEKENKDKELAYKYSSLEKQYKYIKARITSDKDVADLISIEHDLNLYKLMMEKEKPILEVADKDFFDFSTEFNSDKEYLKQNCTGNEDIKVLKYQSAPFIKMPISQ